MISFHYPQSFYLLIPYAILIALYFWSRWQRIRELQKLGDWRLIRQLIPVVALIRRRNKDFLVLIALFIVIFSAAGPQFGSNLKEVKHRGVEVFIAMDTSRSMLAEDVPPTRMDHAKRALGLLINKLEGNRVGIIAFAKRAIIQCPLTTDTDAARMFLEIMDDKTIPEQGTSLGDAIRLGIQSFPKEDKSGRAIVLLTDGEDHSSDPLGAAKQAKEAGISIFTIGIGTTKGEVIKDRDEQGKIVEFHKYKGEMVLSHLDDGLLNELATVTGGRYYRASSTDREIDEIADILNGYDKKEFASKIYERLQERYQYFLFIALLILLIEFFFAETPGQWTRIQIFFGGLSDHLMKIKKPVLGFLILILLSPSLLHADVKSHVRKANRLFEKGDAAGARAEFESARIDLPEAAFLPYNIAATYYVEGNFDEAKKNYEQALRMTRDPSLQSKIAYNMGHLYFSMGQRDQAIQQFKECLKLNPQDVDAKYNIEYIKAGKTPKTPPPQKKDGKGNGDQKQNQNDKNQDPNQKDQNKQSQEDQQAQEKKDKENAQKENAERILQMMQDQEKDKMKNSQVPKPGLSKPKDDKKGEGGEDW